MNSKLDPKKELGGVFLPKDSPRNFDFMFIAEMPSMRNQEKVIESNFDVSTRDKFFQEMTVKYGIGGSYVTDIVKEGDTPRQPTKNEIEKWLPFLLKEIEIIQPKVIIVLGKRTYERSFKPFIEFHLSKNIKIDWVFHYSSQVPRKKFEERFREVINRLK